MASFQERLNDLYSALQQIDRRYDTDLEGIDNMIKYQETLLEGEEYDLGNERIAEINRRIEEYLNERAEIEYSLDDERDKIKKQIIFVKHQIKFSEVMKDLIYKMDHWGRRSAAVAAWYRRRAARKARREALKAAAEMVW